MHKKIDETNLSKPSLLLSNRNRVRRAGAQGAAAGEVRKCCARNTPPRQCCAFVPQPPWSSTSPSQLSRCSSRRARSLAAVGRPGARAPLVGPAAAISLLTSAHFPRPWSPRAVSGVVDVAMGDLSPADTKVHTFG